MRQIHRTNFAALTSKFAAGAGLFGVFMAAALILALLFAAVGDAVIEFAAQHPARKTQA